MTTCDNYTNTYTSINCTSNTDIYTTHNSDILIKRNDTAQIFHFNECVKSVHNNEEVVLVVADKCFFVSDLNTPLFKKVDNIDIKTFKLFKNLLTLVDSEQKLHAFKIDTNITPLNISALTEGDTFIDSCINDTTVFAITSEGYGYSISHTYTQPAETLITSEILDNNT